jgi:hypothetical protein
VSLSAPQSISICDSVKVKASPPGAAPDIIYTWGCMNDEVLDLILKAASGPTVTIIGAQLKIGTQYTLTVQAFRPRSGLSSEIASAPLLITAKSDAMPVLSVDTPPPPVFRSKLLPFVGDASASPCSSASIPIIFAWSLKSYRRNRNAESGSEGSSMISRAQGKTFAIDSSLLIPGGSYSVQLAALYTDGSRVAFTTGHFSIGRMPAVAVLRGNSGFVSRDRRIYLNASDSYDPDSCSSPATCSDRGKELSFAWTCTQMQDKLPCTYKNSTLVSFPAVPLVEIDLSLLQLPSATAHILFEVEVSKASHASAAPARQTTFFQVLPAGTLAFDIQIEVLQQQANAMLFRGLSNTNMNVTYNWSVQMSKLRAVDPTTAGQPLVLSDALTFPLGGGRKTFLLNPSTTWALARIPRGASYIVSLLARSANPMSVGLARMQFQRPVPPTGGQCILEPTQGFALTTTFTVSCSGWSSSALPLQYQFAVTTNKSVENNLAAIDNTTKELNWSPVGTSGEYELLLCPGEFTLFVSISDILVRFLLSNSGAFMSDSFLFSPLMLVMLYVRAQAQYRHLSK